jgi:recombination protein RecR
LIVKLDYPQPVQALILQLKRLPGIGAKSAERMAIWLLQQAPSAIEEFGNSALLVAREIHSCPVCGFFATHEGCVICEAPDRDISVLCVVEQPLDILPIERTGIYHGHYHSLGGRLSPLDNIGPDDLRIAELQTRVSHGSIAELILALGSDVAGEATANYLIELLQLHPLRITKLAQGLPVGGGLTTADSLTLHRALENRGSVAPSARLP